MERSAKVPIWVLITVLWAFTGLLVALNKDYGEIDSGSDAWSFILAVLIWPIVLAGAKVSIRF